MPSREGAADDNMPSRKQNIDYHSPRRGGKIDEGVRGREHPTVGEAVGRLDLALVMPAYNEGECIAGVVETWLEVLSKEDLSFRLMVLNDGSTDDTAQALAGFDENADVEVINKPNSGHGPTILTGYARAVELADWVFQCDSDDEISASYFPELWSRREKYDALLGCRSLRAQPLARRLISWFSRATVRVLCGKGVEDVNVPYRLIRSSLLKRAIEPLPPDLFAPNVIISGALCRAGVRIYNLPVRWEFRRTGTVSIARWKLLKSAFRAFRQTVRYRPRI